MIDNWRLNAIFQINRKKYDEGYERVFGKKEVKPQKPPKITKRDKKQAPRIDVASF